jgi:hypothetical protein
MMRNLMFRNNEVGSNLLGIMEVVAVVDIFGLCWVEVFFQVPEVLLIELGLTLSREGVLH